MYDRKVITFINQTYKVKDLLKHYHGIDAYVGSKFWCPYHKDTDPSAQLFADNNFFCYAERVQYNPFKILMAVGVPYEEMAKAVPGDFIPVDDQKKLFNYELYKQLVFTFSKVFQRDHNMLSVIDNWISVMDNEEGSDVKD